MSRRHTLFTWSMVLTQTAQNGYHGADNISKCIFKIFLCLKYLEISPVNNKPTLIHIIIACEKPISEPMTGYFTDAHMHHSASVVYKRLSEKDSVIIRRSMQQASRHYPTFDYQDWTWASRSSPSFCLFWIVQWIALIVSMLTIKAIHCIIHHR